MGAVVDLRCSTSTMEFMSGRQYEDQCQMHTARGGRASSSTLRANLDEISSTSQVTAYLSSSDKLAEWSTKGPSAKRQREDATGSPSFFPPVLLTTPPLLSQSPGNLSSPPTVYYHRAGGNRQGSPNRLNVGDRKPSTDNELMTLQDSSWSTRLLRYPGLVPLGLASHVMI